MLRYIIATLSIIVLIRCEKPEQEVLPLYPDLNLSSVDSTEAMILTFFLEQTLTAEDSSFRGHLYHLNYLRQTHVDSFPFLDNLRLIPPWEVGSLSLGFEESQIQEILSNQYTGWDSIPSAFRPDSVDVTSENLGFVSAYTSNKYHPVLLARQYRDLPGIKWANARIYGVFDYPFFPILVFWNNDLLEYVFHIRNPSNTEESDSYHFRYIEGEPVYLGEILFSDFTHTDTNYVDLAFEFMFWGQLQ